MSGLRGSWREVTQSNGAPTARSSHDVAVVGHKAYVFGGEIEPRVPIDNFMHVFDLEKRTWSIAETKGEAPLPRVGATMAAIGKVVYVFAGRDKEHEELNEFFSFSTESGEWKLLSSGDKSPPHRSYHALVADEHRKKLYTFGGCGKEGRLNDLWEFDVHSKKWSGLPSPPPKSSLVPRGGPGLAVVDGTVFVLFGFNGNELTDIHRFDFDKNAWRNVIALGDRPTGRSVFGTAVVGKHIVIYGGEVHPSDQGHMGAGAFSNEEFVLDTESLVWSRPALTIKEGKHPGARGWYAYTAYGKSMLVYGGNSDTNDRLDDMYVLTIES
ncbi:unnamed protein product [Calypogeia fissa]